MESYICVHYVFTLFSEETFIYNIVYQKMN